MNCPDCDCELEREDKVSEELDVACPGNSWNKKKPIRKSWGAEYFCSQCHISWYYNSTGLFQLGTNTGTVSDAIARYAHGETDENGQVW
jgi:hypothetical protein